MVALICQLTRTPAPLPGRQPVMMTLFTFSEFYSPEFFEEARRIYESGLSLCRAPRRLKRSKAYVRDTLIAGGVSLRPSTHTPEGKKARSERRMAGPAPYGFTYLRAAVYNRACLWHPRFMEKGTQRQVHRDPAQRGRRPIEKGKAVGPLGGHQSDQAL